MSYSELTAHYRRIAHLEHVAAIIGWDEAVMMSRNGGESRADAQATLGVILHGLRTDPRIGNWIEAAAAEVAGEVEKANLREIRRDHARAVAVDSGLVEACSRAATLCEQAWRTQRAENDWDGHRPLLEEVVKLERERATVLGEALSLDPYDALLDGYDPGMRTAMIDPIFEEIGGFLPQLLEQILEARASIRVMPLEGPFDLESQRRLGRRLMEAVGFDFNRGRLDESHHPFCGGVSDDVRITTRYDESDFTRALMGVLHETGHAKYDQGLPIELADQPVGQARGMSVHESQSLLMEMQVCRSPAFVRFLAPLAREAFPDRAAAQPDAWTAGNLAALQARVERSLIRVDADEVTYPLHIVLRYRIERALIDGALEVGDLPEAWDTGMRELLGLSTGTNYRDGCMQDVHWSAGALGYFPTYTLGALLAAQLRQAAMQTIPDLSERIAEGDLRPLDDWLRERVWQRASILEAPELIREATGAPLGTAAFRAHLEERYLTG